MPQNSSIQRDQRGGINYPSPYFDIASTYVPPSMKEFFKWTRFFYYSHSVIHPIIDKISEYPITGLIYQVDGEEDRLPEKSKKNWKKLLEATLRIKSFQVEMLLDYNVYGNALASIVYPFKRYLKCRECDHRTSIEKARYKWKDFKFHSACEECNHQGVFDVADADIKNRSMCRLTRWNPFFVSIEHNPVTDERDYWYRIPNKDRQAIIKGKKMWIERAPWVFIEAVRDNKQIQLETKNLYHMRRPTIADADMAWGMPVILPVIKDAYWLQILRKANECVSPTTLIETMNGIEEAQNVQKGDFVKSHDGTYQEIFDRWERPINFEDGEVARKVTLTHLRDFPDVVSPNHPYLVIRRNQVNRRKDTKEKQRQGKILKAPHLFEETYVNAESVTPHDYVAYPIHREVRSNQVVDLGKYCDKVMSDDFIYYDKNRPESVEAFETLEQNPTANQDGNLARKLGENAVHIAKRNLRQGKTPSRVPRKVPLSKDLAYIAGWYAGDGSKTTRGICFSCGNDDPVEEIQGACERVFGLRTWVVQTKKKMKTVYVPSPAVGESISGWIPGYAHSKDIPDEIMHAEDEIVAQFLRGYFEADGCRTISRNKIQIVTASRALAMNTYRLITSLGCLATIEKRAPTVSVIDGRRVQSRGSFVVSVCGDSEARLYEWMYDSPKTEVSGGGKSGFIHRGYRWGRVLSVEEDRSCEKVINFSVEKTHTFCTFGKATHNSIALDHIVPWRILFPAANADISPYVQQNLNTWKNNVEEEVKKWRQDPNHISIMPLPIGTQNFGGDAKLLQVWQEEKIIQQQIAGGMGVPLELVFGGLSWSGSSVSLRILENHFIRDREEIDNFMNGFLVPNLQRYFHLSKITIKQKNFKMADDVQQKQLMLQLLQMGKVSDSTVLEENSLDFQEEATKRMQEQTLSVEFQRQQMIQQAEIQGAISVISARYSGMAQAEAAKVHQSMAPPMPPQPGQGGQPQTSQPAQAQGPPSSMPMGTQKPPAPGAASPAMGPPVAMGQGGVVTGANGNSHAAQQGEAELARVMANGMQRMDEAPREMLLKNLETYNPTMAALMRKQLASSKKSSIDMTPLPEQKPPRRKVGPV